jgi:hypothetical protein
MYAQADSNFSFASRSYMFIEDFTSGAYQSHKETYLANGSTAEWIEEHPSGSYPTLANFHTVPFTYAGVTRNYAEMAMGTPSHISETMCSSGCSHNLAVPTSISNSANFSVNWIAGS